MSARRVVVHTRSVANMRAERRKAVGRRFDAPKLTSGSSRGRPFAVFRERQLPCYTIRTARPPCACAGGVRIASMSASCWRMCRSPSRPARRGPVGRRRAQGSHALRLGQDGLSLVCARPISPGTVGEVSLDVPLAGETFTLTVGVRVVYSSYLGVQEFKAGAVFTHVDEAMARAVHKFVFG